MVGLFVQKQNMQQVKEISRRQTRRGNNAKDVCQYSVNVQ